jgi:hypothetical protein
LRFPSLLYGGSQPVDLVGEIPLHSLGLALRSIGSRGGLTSTLLLL